MTDAFVLAAWPYFIYKKTDGLLILHNIVHNKLFAINHRPRCKQIPGWLSVDRLSGRFLWPLSTETVDNRLYQLSEIMCTLLQFKNKIQIIIIIIYYLVYKMHMYFKISWFYSSTYVLKLSDVPIRIKQKNSCYNLR